LICIASLFLCLKDKGGKPKRLATNGETWDAAHPPVAFADKGSSGEAVLFDDCLDSTCPSLHEFVVFAATI